MSTGNGHDAAESGVSQGPSRIQAIRVLAAKTLRWGANKLDPPAVPILFALTDHTNSVSASYRLTFLP